MYTLVVGQLASWLVCRAIMDSASTSTAILLVIVLFLRFLEIIVK